MANLQDILTAAAINLLTAFGFLVAFALLRLQPFNDRVYFPKWYLKGIRGSPTSSGTVVKKFVNLDAMTYIKFLNWMPAALRMPEPELIDHAGLDSAAYIRIYTLGLKIFFPITVVSLAVLVPLHYTNNELEKSKVEFSNIDKLSISNVPNASLKFIAHLILSYVFTFWTCFVLYHEYKTMATKRLRFLASQTRRPDQFSVLVRNVPPDPDESVSEHVEHFFCVNHPDHYLTHQVVYNANKLAKLVSKKKSMTNRLVYYQNKYERHPQKLRPTTKTGFLGLLGDKVDAINYYTTEIEKTSEEEKKERERVASDPQAIMPAAFVSFKSRWGAAVCAQTQQSSNATIWLTEWAPEPRDVYWRNLAIPYVELNVRKLLMGVAFFLLTFFFMIPIAFVQSLANIEKIEKALPFLKPVIEMNKVKSVIQGFLPGIALKIFLAVLPMIIMFMSKIEGYTSLSSLDRRSAAKYHLFILINVFLGSIVAGTAMEQLEKFTNLAQKEYLETIGRAMPLKGTFFITYTMVDGWSGIAAEIIRLVPLVLFHLKNAFLVKTAQDREEAMDPGSLNFATNEPRIQFYLLLGLVYSVVTPILLPFILIFFAFAYVVFRHQIINVYNQKYESGAAFWPYVHMRVIIGLIISQVLVIGLFNTLHVKYSAYILVPQPVLTFWFHRVCKGRFEPAFVTFPLQDAMVKDTVEKATEPTLNLMAYLKDAYVHPNFKGGELHKAEAIDEEESSPLVPTKRTSQMGSKHESEGSEGPFSKS
ncbi:CSC1-like protein At4g02900 [Argentina anserina]|uniref:CSC1-like protein At4g02900 n=1 Tax=Argentina anserina TaxID=57926 RepID=UPI0021763D41|nr:CSC1-like protein At4g02900 [Potentilla anserina]